MTSARLFSDSFEGVVVVLNRAAHQRLEHGGEQPLEILNMCEAHLVLGEGVDGEPAVAGES
jgi:hypothetical protein